MKKKNLLIMLIPFLFLSCESVYFDMNGVNCSINKNIFEKDENIVLNFDGHFDRNDIGYCRISFFVHEIINGEKDKEYFSEFTIIDSYNLLDEEIDEWGYSAFIIKDSKMVDFNNTLSFKMNKPGTYMIEVDLDGATEKQYRRVIKNFDFLFTVNE